MKSFAKMRTIFTHLSAFLLLVFAFGAGQAVAQDGTTVSIPTVSAEAGQDVSVPVNVENFNDVGAITLVINYDAGALTFNALENTPRSGFISNTPSEGELRITWFDATASNPINIDAGKLLDLQFAFSGGAANISFDENASEIADANATVLDVTYEAGIVSGSVGELSLGVVQDAASGESVNVALSADSIGGVGAASIQIGYNPQALNFDGIASDESGLNLQANAEAGVITIGGFNTEGSTLMGTVADLSFTFLGGSSALTFQAETEITDTAGSEQAVATNNGSVSGPSPVLSFPDAVAVPEDTTSIPLEVEGFSTVGSVSLTIQFNDAALDFVGVANEVPNFNITVNQSGTGVITIGGFSTSGADLGDKLLDLRFATTESTTNLTFDALNSEVTTAGSPPLPYNVAYEAGQLNVGNLMLGDVQGNGVVDAGDASLVLQAVVGSFTLNSVQVVAADVDGNGEVQAADASLILQYVVGKIDQFPAESGSAVASKTATGSLAWGDAQFAEDGQTVAVPVSLTGANGNVTAAQFTVQYDPSMVSFDEFEGAAPSSWQVATNNQSRSGLLKVAMAGADAISSGELATLRFKLNGNEAATLSGSGVINAEATSSFGTAQLDQAPSSITLEANYPNPFKGSTTITYGLPSDGQVTIEVYSITGQKVATLVNRDQSAGTHKVSFDASGLASGMYMYRLTAGDVTKTGRMTVVK